MPLVLPPGTYAEPSLASGAPLLHSRVTNYRFELLDNDENLLGQLNSVEPGGSITWDASASIKAGGSIPVTDVGTDIDWLNVRIRPIIILRESPGGVAGEVPTGVYIPSAPVEDWSAVGRRWNVELLDKNSILDQDIVTDPITGDPFTYVAATGDNVIDLIIALIAGAGEDPSYIEPGEKALDHDLFWDVGTTRLKIINDLLEAANYFSLVVDPYGHYICRPYVPPADRSPVYVLEAPFSNGPMSLMDPDWKRDRDIYAIPNRYVAIGAGTGDTAALVQAAENLDPTSPFSYPSRGRWITTVETGVEFATEPDLLAYAERRLTAAASVTSKMDVSHLLLPDLTVNTVVRMVNAEAGLDVLCTVSSTTVPFAPTDLCSTSLTEVITV